MVQEKDAVVEIFRAHVRRYQSTCWNETAKTRYVKTQNIFIFAQSPQAMDPKDEALDLADIPLIPTEWADIELHRRFLRVKNLWVKIVSHLIMHGYRWVQ